MGWWAWNGCDTREASRMGRSLQGTWASDLSINDIWLLSGEEQSPLVHQWGVATLHSHAKPNTHNNQRHTHLSGHTAGNTVTSIGACQLDSLILKAWIWLPWWCHTILLHLLEKKSEDYSFYINSHLWFADHPQKLHHHNAWCFDAGPSCTRHSSNQSDRTSI